MIATITELVGAVGVQTAVIVLLGIGILFVVQRKRLADMVWSYVLDQAEEFESFVGDELEQQESQTREWMYAWYDSLPATLRTFMSRKTYEYIVDQSFGKLYDLLFDDKDE